MSFAAAAALNGIASIGSAMLNQYYNKKNMRDQAALEYAYAQRYALNSPSWNVQGLRDAGLNPILAVSNGVNLGANIPNITNSSPNAKIDLNAVEALKAAKETDIGQQNADSTSEMAGAQEVTAEANMLRAKADATLKQAQTTETLQRTLRMNQSKYSSPIVRDVMGMIDNLKIQSKDVIKEASAYLQNAPSRVSSRNGSLPKGTSTNVRHSEIREKKSNQLLDSYWKSNKPGPDGTSVYRKRGDIGGVMHIYR